MDQLPSSVDIGWCCGEGGDSPSFVSTDCFLASCCSRSLEMTVPFNLSSCLEGSQRSASVAEMTEAVAAVRMFFVGTVGVAGEGTLGLLEEGGSGVSPSFCLTYD